MKETAENKKIIEALLFVTNDPITKNQMQEVVKGLSSEDIDKCIAELNEEYLREGHSFQIEEIAGGWQMRTRPDYGQWVKALLNIQRRERLSGPALETLAIIAYKQPITKVEIEGIRGVNTDWVLSSIIDKNLVRIVGKKDIVGHPFMYGTTTRFLEHFGLASLKDLPQVEELKGANIFSAAAANPSVEKKEEALPEAIQAEAGTTEVSIVEAANEEKLVTGDTEENQNTEGTENKI